MLTKLAKAEVRQMRADLPPPSADDVSVTFDGRRLDSKDAVLEFLASLDNADE